jgi:hypothetical protein
LASKSGSFDVASVRVSLVGIESRELRSMPLVTAGDPAQSYLMHKLDGDLCMFEAQCENGACGDSMPPNGPPLGPSFRDVVRRWVAQGAADN